MLVAANVGVVPAMAKLLASFRVMVIVEVATPFAVMLLVPTIEEFTAEAAPGLNTTVPPLMLMGEVMLSVFVSAVLDFKVHVENPELLLAEHAP